jgi:hypothetical protein
MESETIQEGLRIASQYGNKFFFDGCHKIYIINKLNEEEEIKQGLSYGYKMEDIFNINELKRIFNECCPLKFISSLDLEISFIKQQ